MPEGHSVHRIAAQFRRHFVGKRAAVSSPQGRFGDCVVLDGHTITNAYAVGKHLFITFDSGDSLHVHLGIYGAWDFAGDVALDDTAASAGGRMGQTAGRGTVVGAHEESLASIGAPRRTRLRMGESERSSEQPASFPPEPIGQVRVRILTVDTVADLRGPTVCEVLSPTGVDRVQNDLGPDPLVDKRGEERFIERCRSTSTPIGRALMNQKIVAGIGNVYRAEMLFRARLSPFAVTKNLPDDTLRELWSDWVKLLGVGVKTGQMLTMDGMTASQKRAALANRDDRHWVYRRAGEPCRVCGTHIVMEMMEARKLYFCPQCQGVSE
ncbi:MAG: Fpg/Nei family DNA glycosylase [Microbacteriaceae bacterium]